MLEDIDTKIMEISQLESVLSKVLGKAVRKLDKSTYLNQNFLVFIFTIAGLVFVELKDVSSRNIEIPLWILTWVSLISVGSTMIAYSINYWHRRMAKSNQYNSTGIILECDVRINLGNPKKNNE